MDKKVYQYISEQTNDPIVERKICAVSGKEFAVFQSDLDFYSKISPSFDGQKFSIPTPQLCPEERQRRRLAWRNERKLYRRICDFSWNDIVSVYSPDKPYTVYQQKIWRSDVWSPLDYGTVFDDSHTFFTQYDALLKTVPTLAMMNDDGLGTSENCSYCQDFAFGKDCYMTTATRLSQDCLYCDCCLEVKDCIDCIMVNNHSQNVYQWSHCSNIQHCSYISNSVDSHDCHFCEAVNGCSFCFGCVGLQNTKYYIFNQEYSPTTYKQKIQEIYALGHNRIQEMFATHLATYPKEAMIQRKSENSYGNNIFSSTNITIWFDIIDVENAKYVTRLNSHAKDCYDIHQSGSPVLTYEWITPDKAYHCAFVSRCREHCKYLYYCDNCHSCVDCFACVWLRNKQYCIFNKQYSKQDYEREVHRIITKMQETKERGEFPPIQISPFGYNETAANEYFPLTEQEVKEQWYSRYAKTTDPSVPANTTVIDRRIPSYGQMNDSDIIHSIFLCELSWKPYRILEQELQFYRKNEIPIPRKHPDSRHSERIQKLPSRDLYLRTCSKTGKEILSAYPPDVPFPVRSPEAYTEHIYN